MVQLSIVVPVYNVERYLGACLQSLQQQSLTDFEVVIVDDGSPDGSVDIARRWCAEDARFRLLRQENHGLGHARNTGASHATGEYLTFVDSDDVIPRHAYRHMIGKLTESGSDVCTGAVMRLFDTGLRVPSGLSKGIHDQPATRTSVGRRPALLRDRLAMNKVWRRSYWEQHGWRFPVGVLYEDTPVIIPALVTANGIDVASRVVYLWRRRGVGPSSITQDRTEVRHVRDRTTAVTSVSEFLATAEPPKLKRIYDHSVLTGDLDIFINRLDIVDDEHGKETRQLVRLFLENVQPAVLKQLPAHQRVNYFLAAQNDLEALQEYAAFRRDGGLKRTPYVVEGKRVVLDLPQRRTANLPDRVVDDAPNLELNTRAVDMRQDGHRWFIDGWAYIEGLSVDTRKAATIRVWIGGQKGVPASRWPRRSQMRVRRRVEPQATVQAGHLVHNYDWAGFQASIPVRRLLALVERADVPLYIFVEVTAGPVSRTGVLSTAGPGRVRSPAPFRLSDGGLLRPRWGSRGLQLDVVEPRVQVTGVRSDDETMRLELMAPDQRPDAKLVVRTAQYRSTFQVKWRGSRTTQVAVPLNDILRNQFGHAIKDAPHTEWAGDAVLGYREPRRGPRALRLDDPSQQPVFEAGGRELVLRQTTRGFAALTYQPAHPRLRVARWLDAATLEIDVDVAPHAAVNGWYMRSRSSREPRPGVEVAREGRRRTVRFLLGGKEGSEEDAAVQHGWWNFEATIGADTVDIAVPSTLADQLLGPLMYRRREYRVDADAGKLVVRVGAQLAGEELGPQRQYALQSVEYPRFRIQPLQDALIYDCHGGRQWSDNPRVLHEELVRRAVTMDHLVVSGDQQVSVPASAREVPMSSRDHYRTMATSRVVVFNSFQPRWFETRSDQLVIQTWHGTALKLIGLDNKAAKQKGPAEQRRLAALAATWSWMVSPSPFMTDVYRTGWGFQGRVLETGYPRNDAFYAPDADHIQARTRARLDISPDQRLILYAPTFRDHHRKGNRRGRALTPMLDLIALCQELGPDDVLVVRSHHLAGLRIPTDPSLPLRDASRYPDVQHLLLSADVLVTDYSSVMFDFANTGRPMYFFTPDIDDYQDYVRGFYWNLEEVAPGPVIRDQADLAAALARGRGLSGYEQRYARFRERFCPWDDGGAAARLADAVLKELDGS